MRSRLARTPLPEWHHNSTHFSGSDGFLDIVNLSFVRKFSNFFTLDLSDCFMNFSTFISTDFCGETPLYLLLPSDIGTISFNKLPTSLLFLKFKTLMPVQYFL